MRNTSMPASLNEHHHAPGRVEWLEETAPEVLPHTGQQSPLKLKLWPPHFPHKRWINWTSLASLSSSEASGWKSWLQSENHSNSNPGPTPYSCSDKLLSNSELHLCHLRNENNTNITYFPRMVWADMRECEYRAHPCDQHLGITQDALLPLCTDMQGPVPHTGRSFCTLVGWPAPKTPPMGNSKPPNIHRVPERRPGRPQNNRLFHSPAGRCCSST